MEEAYYLRFASASLHGRSSNPISVMNVFVYKYKYPPHHSYMYYGNTPTKIAETTTKYVWMKRYNNSGSSSSSYWGYGDEYSTFFEPDVNIGYVASTHGYEFGDPMLSSLINTNKIDGYKKILYIIFNIRADNERHPTKTGFDYSVYDGGPIYFFVKELDDNEDDSLECLLTTGASFVFGTECTATTEAKGNYPIPHTARFEFNVNGHSSDIVLYRNGEMFIGTPDTSSGMSYICLYADSVSANYDYAYNVNPASYTSKTTTYVETTSSSNYPRYTCVDDMGLLYRIIPNNYQTYSPPHINLFRTNTYIISNIGIRPSYSYRGDLTITQYLKQTGSTPFQIYYNNSTNPEKTLEFTSPTNVTLNSTLNSGTIHWESSNPEVATVGEYTGILNVTGTVGETVITAYVNGTSYKYSGYYNSSGGTVQRTSRSTFTYISSNAIKVKYIPNYIYYENMRDSMTVKAYNGLTNVSIPLSYSGTTSSQWSLSGDHASINPNTGEVTFDGTDTEVTVSIDDATFTITYVNDNSLEVSYNGISNSVNVYGEQNNSTQLTLLSTLSPTSWTGADSAGVVTLTGTNNESVTASAYKEDTNTNTVYYSNELPITYHTTSSLNPLYRIRYGTDYDSTEVEGVSELRLIDELQTSEGSIDVTEWSSSSGSVTSGGIVTLVGPSGTTTVKVLGTDIANSNVYVATFTITYINYTFSIAYNGSSGPINVYYNRETLNWDRSLTMPTLFTNTSDDTGIEYTVTGADSVVSSNSETGSKFTLIYTGASSKSVTVSASGASNSITFNFYPTSDLTISSTNVSSSNYLQVLSNSDVSGIGSISYEVLNGDVVIENNRVYYVNTFSDVVRAYGFDSNGTSLYYSNALSMSIPIDAIDKNNSIGFDKMSSSTSNKTILYINPDAASGSYYKTGTAFKLIVNPTSEYTSSLSKFVGTGWSVTCNVQVPTLEMVADNAFLISARSSPTTITVNIVLNLGSTTIEKSIYIDVSDNTDAYPWQSKGTSETTYVYTNTERTVLNNSSYTIKLESSYSYINVLNWVTIGTVEIVSAPSSISRGGTPTLTIGGGEGYLVPVETYRSDDFYVMNALKVVAIPQISTASTSVSSDSFVLTSDIDNATWYYESPSPSTITVTFSPTTGKTTTATYSASGSAEIYAKNDYGTSNTLTVTCTFSNDDTDTDMYAYVAYDDIGIDGASEDIIYNIDESHTSITLPSSKFSNNVSSVTFRNYSFTTANPSSITSTSSPFTITYTGSSSASATVTASYTGYGTVSTNTLTFMFNRNNFLKITSEEVSSDGVAKINRNINAHDGVELVIDNTNIAVSASTEDENKIRFLSNGTVHVYMILRSGEIYYYSNIIELTYTQTTTTSIAWCNESAPYIITVSMLTGDSSSDRMVLFSIDPAIVVNTWTVSAANSTSYTRTEVNAPNGLLVKFPLSSSDTYTISASAATNTPMVVVIDSASTDILYPQWWINTSGTDYTEIISGSYTTPLDVTGNRIATYSMNSTYPTKWQCIDTDEILESFENSNVSGDYYTYINVKGKGKLYLSPLFYDSSLDAYVLGNVACINVI